jgi:hypothetical protein
LEKCTDYKELKKLYLQALLANNKPDETLAFIRDKLNEDEKHDEDFHYYQAKAWYFNGE